LNYYHSQFFRLFMGKSCHNPGKTFRINITRAKLAKFHTIHHKFILITYTPENVEEMIIMRKQVKAILAAMLITGVVAIFMAVIGVNAMTNRNGTVVSNLPPSAAVVTSTDLSSLPADQQISQLQAQVDQLQADITQYQSREQQYQSALDSDNQQLQQYSSEIQMIQQLLAYLQNKGLIQITSQGQILVTGGR
jgi:hypothetical protein